jgi:hypothetical protein
MEEFEFRGLSPDTHHCTSHRDGDWIVWRCPVCEQYERRYNTRTEEMRVRRGGSEARHAGYNAGGDNMKPLLGYLRDN